LACRPKCWCSLTGVIQLCISGNVYAEYEEVLRRAKFRRDEETIAATLEAIRNDAHWVRPTETVTVSADPDDNMFLECAEAAMADYLVTGNLKHFPTSWCGTRVVTARWLLDIVAGGTGNND
jgi:putative PIN family toxin of toxin-antitoxin system